MAIPDPSNLAWSHAMEGLMAGPQYIGGTIINRSPTGEERAESIDPNHDFRSFMTQLGAKGALDYILAEAACEISIMLHSYDKPEAERLDLAFRLLREIRTD